MITFRSCQNRPQLHSVQNILHNGKTNNRTTEAAREVQKERMKEYTQMLTSDVLQAARKNLSFNMIKANNTHRPLTAKDVYPKAWKEKKVKNDPPTMINHQLLNLMVKNFSVIGRLPPREHLHWRNSDLF